MLSAIKKSVQFFISLIIAIKVIDYFDIQNNILTSFLDIIGLCVVYYLIENAIKEKNKMTHILSAFFSILLSLSFVVGSKVDFHNKIMYELSGRDVLECVFWAMPIFLCMVFVFRYALKHESVLKFDKIKTSRWLLLSVICLLGWVFYYLVYFPGSLSGDSYSSVQQALGEANLNNHHPVLFTLIVKLFVKIGLLFGSVEIGVGLFSLFQMIVLALVLGRTVEWLYVKGARKEICFFAEIFYALNPLIAIYSFTMWKDILFSAGVILLVMVLYDILTNKEKNISKNHLIELVFVCLWIAFLRNNGIYIVIIVLGVLGIYYSCRWEKVVPVFAAVLLVIVLIQGPVYKAFGINKSGLAESLGVPLQQIGYTLKNDGNITQEQKEFLNNIMPLEVWKENYHPCSVDPVKFHSEFNKDFFEENKIRFLMIWAELLPLNPVKYIKGYISLTVGYWYVGIKNWKCTYGVEDFITNVSSTNFIEKFTGKDFSMWIRNFVEVNLTDMPVISYLYRIAFPVWLMFFCIFLMIIRKEKRYIIALLPLLINWGTLMIATPIFCEFRYMFSFHLAIPVLFSLILLKSNPNENVNTQ